MVSNTGISDISGFQGKDVRAMTNRHKILMENRSKLTVTEVSDVYSFDESSVNLQIGGDTDLTVSGEELTITKLEIGTSEGGGEVVVTGTIEALVYSESGRTGNATGGRRLFGLFK